MVVYQLGAITTSRTIREPSYLPALPPTMVTALRHSTATNVDVRAIDLRDGFTTSCARLIRHYEKYSLLYSCCQMRVGIKVFFIEWGDGLFELFWQIVVDNPLTTIEN